MTAATRSRAFGALAAIMAAGWSAAAAQELPRGRTDAEGVTGLVLLCTGDIAARAAPCRELVLAAMAVQRGVGLASALGSDIPGTPSTTGRRIGSVPRLGFAIAATGIAMGMPRVSASSAAGLEEEARSTPAGLRAVVSAGVLDGLQSGPGLGGFLSADLTASYSRLWLPEAEGFGGPSSGVGLGARVGILRESFTVPGISVSIARRWHGAVATGDVAGGNPGELETDLEVTSLRAMVGKNWFVVGLMAGAGWDRYVGEATVAVGEGVDDPGAVSGTIASERTVYFASAWYNFLVSQLSVEVGFGDGLSDPFAGRSGGYDPGERNWFASAALRITP